MARKRRLTNADYAQLLAVRTRLRTFEQWSAQQAGAHGLSPAQHQLLLAVRGHDDPRGPTIRQVADYLLIRHNTAVELVDRSQRQDLVERTPDASDRRAVRLRLTDDGRARIDDLSAAHLNELAALRPLIDALVGDLTES